MKNSTIGLLVALGLFCLFAYTKFNSLTSLDFGAKKAWSQVENDYQTRMDKINNLVATVKGAGNFESQALKDVIAARASATQMKVDASNLSPEQIEKFQAAQGSLTQAMGRLMVVNEQYPTLQATAQYKDLAAEISGTENRCNKSRRDFNDAVGAFDISMKQFPANIIAGLFGFKEKGFFKMDDAAKTAPKVDFETKK
jgi:LemA protein